MYGIDSLTSFLSGGRNLIANYLFGGNTDISLDQYLYGYVDRYIEHMTDERPFLAGKEVDLEAFISPLLTDD